MLTEASAWCNAESPTVATLLSIGGLRYCLVHGMVINIVSSGLSMLHPLASLWRHSGRATFYESGGVSGQAMLQAAGQGAHPPAGGSRRRFGSADEAYGYLRFWVGEPSARAELRWVLQRSGPSLVSTQTGPDGWLHALAGRLASGAVVVLEEMSRQAMPGRLMAPGSAAMTSAMTSVIAALPSLDAMPALPQIDNVLPALEELYTVSADVLPELDQALAQINIAIGHVSAASLSLEAMPPNVAPIAAAVRAAGADASAALGAL